MGCCCAKEKERQQNLAAKGVEKGGGGGAANTEQEGPYVQFPHHDDEKEESKEKQAAPPTEPKPPLEAPGSVVKRTSDKQVYFVAQNDYTPESKAEISLKAGDVLRVVQDDGGGADPDWLFVTHVGGTRSGTGYVPRGYVAQKGTLAANLWYFGPLPRKEAEDLLRPAAEGAFLIRSRDSSDKVVPRPAIPEFTLSVKKKNDQIQHFQIWHLTDKYGGGYFLSKKRKFDSLDNLVEWYRSSGEIAEKIGLVEPPKKNPPKKVTLSADAQKRWREIPRSQIQRGPLVGKGNFGMVYQGTWTPDGGPARKVAVKELKKGSTAAKHQFIKEAAVMKNLLHENLVQMYGVITTEEPYWLVTEFVKDGSLLKYLHSKKYEGGGGSLPERTLVDICLQVARGMRYLEEKHVVHRDLAARNVLVDAGAGDDRLVVKIADFGMAKLMADDIDPKTARRRVRDIPTKWTAPEALDKGLFSTKSDVWSFGIFAHEVFSFGNDPYGICSKVFVRRHVVVNRQILPRNQYVPIRIYESMMKKCFEYEPEKRPTFKEVYDFLNTYYSELPEMPQQPSKKPTENSKLPSPRHNQIAPASTGQAPKSPLKNSVL